jgi:hypothetical protein
MMPELNLLSPKAGAVNFRFLHQQDPALLMHEFEMDKFAMMMLAAHPSPLHVHVVMLLLLLTIEEDDER